MEAWTYTVRIAWQPAYRRWWRRLSVEVRRLT